VTWWRWHGGAAGDGRFAPRKEFSSPRSAAAEYRAGSSWGTHRGLLPWISAQNPWLYIECGDRDAGLAPVVYEHKGEARQLLTGSLGDLVELWTGFVEEKVWTYERGRIPEEFADDVLRLALPEAIFHAS
jgi:hypothetical protein